ncbi:UNVERIFIED_CONTAM: YfdQ family protein [Acinetobacter pittii]
MSELNNLSQAIELTKPVLPLTRGELVAVHRNYAVIDGEIYSNTRLRARGALTTPSFEDFKTFVEEEETEKALVFVNHKEMSATAVLNYSAENAEQGHCDYTSTLNLEPTVVWTKLLGLKDKKLSQKSFAIFLEDWASVLSVTGEAKKDEQGNPELNEHGEEIFEKISIKDAIQAVRNMQVDSKTNSSSEVENTRQVHSAMASIAASTKKGKLPAYFAIKDSAYVGLDEREIKLRLVVNGQDGEASFALQIVKEELLLNQIVEDFKIKVIELLPQNPVRIGVFHPSKH